MHKPTRVLFVCLGNICRSPLAEVIVSSQAEKKGLAEQFSFSSAGTGDWHIGGRADPRSEQTAKQHGLDLSQHQAQQITRNNINLWDYFVAMDADNHRNLLHMGVHPGRLLMMRQFESAGEISLNVPDPYYGGEDGFEDIYHIFCANADILLRHLRNFHLR
ncbi:MAG: low molecular weight protein-tyrosine-phosphatase [Mariprofundaceae bacterium]|nr:low molecular weight protein-tyrosine-phosphatase [Mariprofundaceae bacterium]